MTTSLVTGQQGQLPNAQAKLEQHRAICCVRLATMLHKSRSFGQPWSTWCNMTQLNAECNVLHPFGRGWESRRSRQSHVTHEAWRAWRIYSHFLRVCSFSLVWVRNCTLLGARVHSCEPTHEELSGTDRVFARGWTEAQISIPKTRSRPYARVSPGDCLLTGNKQ